jgi:DNA-binding MarR family transcriptional regulator
MSPPAATPRKGFRRGQAGSRAGGRAFDVADRLHSAAIHLLRRLRVQDDATGVSAPRLSALSVLVFGGPRTVSGLAAAEQVRVPTMTRLVQGLRRSGLVTCAADPLDRRCVRVVATARGARLLRGARARRVGALAGQLAALTPDGLECLDRAARLLASLEDTA